MDTEGLAALAMMRYNGSDTRRVNHALKVYGTARAIAAGEALEGFSLRALELAALLHDIGIHEAERKYGSAAGQYQELEGPPIAQKILEQLGAEPELAQRVCYLVGHHHSYTLVDGPDFQALVEADFIVNIGEDGLSAEQARKIRSRVFKTGTGTALLAALYAL